MIKAILKNTEFWTKISYSNIYLKFTNRAAYDRIQREYSFYKNWLKADGRGDELIFDVGANCGTKSALFSRLCKKVVAFEPSDKMNNLLKLRFKNTNVDVIKCALGKQSTTATFYELEGFEALNSLSKKHIETTVVKKLGSVDSRISPKEIPVKTLEEFIKFYKEPLYVKIDVEGYEYEVIQGLKTPVKYLSFEVNLPEFMEEAVKVVQYLAEISSNRYVFNFTNSNAFLLNEPVNEKDAIDFLKSKGYNYLEVYVALL